MPWCSNTIASLRILGKNCDPVLISNLLGATPDKSYKAGDAWLIRGHPERVRIVGLWSLRSTLPRTAALSEHVENVLHRLTNDLTAWESLNTQGLDVEMFCGIFMNDANEGIQLPPELLKQLGNRRISLGMDIYQPMTQEGDAE